jgi:hypothetical protein
VHPRYRELTKMLALREKAPALGVVGSFFAALGADERVAEVSFTDSSLSVALKD